MRRLDTVRSARGTRQVASSEQQRAAIKKRDRAGKVEKSARVTQQLKCVCNFLYATSFFPYSPIRRSLFAFSLCVCTRRQIARQPNIKDNESFLK
jgi:hypothetical protein